MILEDSDPAWLQGSIWGWTENPSWRVPRPLGSIRIYLIGFGGLKDIPIDKELLIDPFRRILISGTAIFDDFRTFSILSILLRQNPRSWYYLRTVFLDHLALETIPRAYTHSTGTSPWYQSHEHMLMVPVLTMSICY